MIATVAPVAKGRALRHALPHALLIGLCMLGLSFMARGAMIPVRPTFHSTPTALSIRACRSITR